LLLLLAVLLFVASCSGTAPPGEPEVTETEAGDPIRVEVSVDCSLVLEKEKTKQNAKDVVDLLIARGRCDREGVFFRGDLVLYAGASAFDALQATGLKVNYLDSSFGPFVQAIEGLGQGDGGGTSGWVYLVNGQAPAVSSGLYQLADGDQVRWRYSVEEADTMGDSP
jgi:hypothetical protein